MDRSKFLKSGLLATGAILAGNAAIGCTTDPAATIATAPGKPFNLNYGPHDGMFKNSAGSNFLDQIQLEHMLNSKEN